MGLNDTFYYAEYHSDDGNTYVVKVSDAVGTAGGFAASSTPLGTPGYPFGPRNMRHVWGRDGDGNRTRLPLAASNASLFTDGGTFSLHGRTYVVQGAIGEKRALSYIGG